MRILYICRLFTGFEESLKEGLWAPKGSPTVAKMIDYLDQSQDVDLTLVMTCKDYNSSWTSKKDQIKTLENLKTPIHILAGKASLPSWLWKFQEKLNNIRQIWVIWRLYKQTKPDLIYCDRVNLLAAAFFARFTSVTVVWRVMGVLQQMHQNKNTRTLYGHFFQYLWASPFANVICSLDGSGGKPWLDQVLNPQTQINMIVNGYDSAMDSKPIKLPENDKVKVLVAGRIEHLKGLIQILETVQILKHENQTSFQILLAGYGSEEKWMRAEIKKRQLDNFFCFLGGLSPEQMKYVRQKSDLYISANTHGNMTNTVIEALSEGLCTIIPKANISTNVDIDTESFLPENVAYRYGKQNESQKLAAAINKFIQNPSERAVYSKNAKSFAAKTFVSWKKRIKYEYELLENMVSSNQ